MRKLRLASRLPVIRSLFLVWGVRTLSGGQARMRELRQHGVYIQDLFVMLHTMAGRSPCVQNVLCINAVFIRCTRCVKIRLKPELQATALRESEGL